jgi:hypothetical protein
MITASELTESLREGLMNTTYSRRLGILAALGMSLSPVLFAADPPKSDAKPQFYNGKVVSLATYFEKLGTKMDREAAPQWYGLVTDDGKIYPLIKDDGSRMFFKDERLLNRPMRLTARLIGNSNFLQVFQVHSYLKNQLHEVYYWCDICAIKRFEKKDCDCCGAPMIFREEPVK